MIIARVARVALRRQAIATTILARPTPAYARSSSFWDSFKTRRVVGEVREPTDAKETETKTTETKVTEAKANETEETETQPVKKPPFDTVPVDTPPSENQLNKDELAKEEPAKDESAKDQPAEEEPNDEFKVRFKDRQGQGRSPRTQPADQPKQREKVPYNSRHGPKWIHVINRRLRALQERQRTKRDIPRSIWRDIGRVNASVKQNWSRVFASSEGFLTPNEGVAGLSKHEVSWGDMDNMVSHVNNVMYNKYAEASRINWIRGLSEYRKDNTKEEVQEYLQLMTPQSTGLVLGSIKTWFKFPVTFPDRVSVFHKITKPPEPNSDHFILEAIILSEYHYRTAARLTEEIVIYDHIKGKNSTLKPNQVRDLNRIFKRQPLNRAVADKEIDDWMDRLTDLEMKVQMKGRRLRDIPLRDAAVESAIDDALRATDELDARSRYGEAPEDLEISKKLEAEDAEATKESKESRTSYTSKAAGFFKRIFKWS